MTSRKSQNGINQTTVRQIVREELIPINNRLDKLEKITVRKVVKEELVPVNRRLDRLENEVGDVKEEIVKMKDDLVSTQDQILGELQRWREEQEITVADHRRILNLEDSVEKLEEIHPQGKHAPSL